MHIKWGELFKFCPRGWYISKFPDDCYKDLPLRCIIDRTLGLEAALQTRKSDVAFILGVCIKSIARGITEREKPLTENMLQFIRHALFAHFGSTMVGVKDETIQDVAKDFNRSMKLAAQPL